MQDSPLKITVTCGTGKGATSLSASDTAIFNAGIGNHNLLHLSSVIPADFAPVIEQADYNYTKLEKIFRINLGLTEG